ncbi:MAG: homocysteine S-methyltransferase family protein [Spiribacter sp.]|nr:homocysteine S-methyltransferase family protein [Spiribacter sp.]
MTNKHCVILDGGMGQELHRRSRQPASPLWSAQVMLDEPELVVAAHRDFIDAGAKVITVNSYTATPQRLARDGAQSWFESLHTAALEAAHQAREQSGADDVRIAGCLPPLVASYHPDVVPDDATCLASYQRIVAMQAERVDLFIAETLSLQREALAATQAAIASELPVWIAYTVSDDNGGQLRSGESLADAAKAAQAAGANALLVNCSAPEAITTAMPILAQQTLPFGGYGNGFQAAANLKPGGTVEGLATREELTPEAYAAYAKNWAGTGATLIGGCCEIGPEHIQSLSNSLT